MAVGAHTVAQDRTGQAPVAAGCAGSKDSISTLPGVNSELRIREQPTEEKSTTQ